MALMLPMGKTIDYFNKSDGRDKLAKTIQNYCRVLDWYLKEQGDKEGSAHYKALASSLSEFRSLMKFFRWLKNVNELQDLMSKPVTLIDAVDVCVNIGDFGYRLGDNLEYLSKYKVIGFDPEQCEKVSKTFQFWGYAASVVLDVLTLLQVEKKKFSSREEYQKKKNAVLLDLIKDTADLIRVAPATGYVPMLSVHKGRSGVCGVLAGAIGIYQTWKKCKN